MIAMQNFTLWFIQNIPAFLLSEPIKYLWGLMLLGYIFKLIVSFRSF